MDSSFLQGAFLTIRIVGLRFEFCKPLYNIAMERNHRIANLLLDQRTADGHWEGQLSASALSTATAISTLSFYACHFPSEDVCRLIDGGLRWLVQEQNADGGWGDTDKNYSNISTTMLVVAAMTAAEKVPSGLTAVGVKGGSDIGRADGDSRPATPRWEAVKTQAWGYIDTCGGVDAVRRRYGKDKTFAVPILANCAMAGIVPWSEVSALPFEAACVPQRFYRLLQLPVVSYAIPALVAIGQCKFLNDPPWNPVRRTIGRLAIGHSLMVLQRMQPQSGGYLEAIPLTSFVCMALIESGRGDHEVVKNGIRFLLDSVRVIEGGDCCWPIDTNLATWTTSLAINAFANDPRDFADRVQAQPQLWRGCFDWLMDCQNQAVHPFTGSPPGGWGWTDLTGSVPDADDTPGALIALRHAIKLVPANPPKQDLCSSANFGAGNRGGVGQIFDDDFRLRIFAAADAGIDWLLKLQNRDHGWPTFCRGWSNLPFDRSGADLTAHVLRALAVWRGVEGLSVDRGRIDRGIDTGLGYLRKTQRPDGSWLPLWFGNQDQKDDLNPFYGTAKVIQAFADLDLIDTNAAQIGLDWLVQHQNVDGGFGGGVSVKYADRSLGHSSVEETALCTDALLNSNQPRHRDAAVAGVTWIKRATDLDVIDHCHPIGFYFAKLWYHEKLYPLVFAMSAMAKFNRDQPKA